LKVERWAEVISIAVGIAGVAIGVYSITSNFSLSIAIGVILTLVMLWIYKKLEEY
jgi:hypothetical protein